MAFPMTNITIYAIKEGAAAKFTGSLINQRISANYSIAVRIRILTTYIVITDVVLRVSNLS